MSGVISGLIGGVLAMLLTQYISRQVGKAGRPGELRFGGFMWGLAIACTMFALLPVGLTLAGHQGEFWAKAALFVGFGAGAVYCFAEAALVRGTYDAHEIRFHAPWTGTKHEKWSDLMSMEYVASCSWYTLTFASGKKVRLSEYLHGHVQVLEIVYTELAGEDAEV
jgi:hypothetical protein